MISETGTIHAPRDYPPIVKQILDDILELERAAERIIRAYEDSDDGGNNSPDYEAVIALRNFRLGLHTARVIALTSAWRFDQPQGIS